MRNCFLAITVMLAAGAGMVACSDDDDSSSPFQPSPLANAPAGPQGFAGGPPISPAGLTAGARGACVPHSAQGARFRGGIAGRRPLNLRGRSPPTAAPGRAPAEAPPVRFIPGGAAPIPAAPGRALCPLP